MNRLPVRPEPWPGEDLYSLIERTAQANGISAARIGLTWTALHRRITDPDALQQISEALGLPAARLRELTVDEYPRGLVGRGTKGHARTWRVIKVRWVCPSCTATTGVFRRDWQLALQPVCLQCRSLLTTSDLEPAAPHLLTPDVRALAVQREISDVLARQLGSPHVDPRFRRLYKLVTLVAATMDDTWPVFAGWEAQLHRATGAQRQDWSRRPPPSPELVAPVLLSCWRALEDTQYRRLLIQEGWQRLAEHLVPEVRDLRKGWRKVLPTPVEETEGIPLWRAENWQAYRDLIRRLEILARTSALAPEHVPAWPDLEPGVVRLAPEAIPTRQELAVCLHMLLSGPMHNEACERRSRAALGLPGTGWITRRLAHGRGILPHYAQAIARAARCLVADGLVDYAERRRHLTSTPALRRRLRLGLDDTDAEDGEVAAAWAWMHLVRSPVGDRALARRAIDLDGRIDPATRLALERAALAHLTEADSPGISPSATAAVPATRRPA